MQWERFHDDELFLFLEWIYPNTLDDFKGKRVLECGCGGGQHTTFVAPYAKEVLAVDLNTVDIAKQRNKQFANVAFYEDDIVSMDLARQFDIVFSIGVVHHTDNPDRAVKNLSRHVKAGGNLILWVYSAEGNFLAKNIVEPIRHLFLRKIKREKILILSKIMTVLMYVPIYSLYLLPLHFLPYYYYFQNFRKLSFKRNVLNVFDKLNAPQVDFITRARVEKWFNDKEFKNIHISRYKGVSWRASGVKSGKNNINKS